MNANHQNSSDPNQTGHRVVSDATAKHEQPLPADLEQAWAEWSKGVQQVDERTRTLLRAAFEAGASAAGEHTTQTKS
ncbi:MAG: hypothetical protein WD534_18075 [Phycisphaeraceae bacterium]